MKNKKGKIKKGKGKTKTKKVLVPSKPSTEVKPDFTTTALSKSNSKRIRFVRAIEKLIPTVTKKEKFYSIEKLVGDYGLDYRLARKVSKLLGLDSRGIVIKNTKFAKVEERLNSLVIEISIVKK